MGKSAFGFASFGACLVLLLVAGCGNPGDLVSKRTRGDSEPSADKGFSLTSVFSELSVPQIQIVKPYCRFGMPQMKVASYCTGTVVSDRYLITAAHCLASDCPSAKNLTLSDISIPSAPTGDMTGYDWDNPDNKISAKNFEIVGGGAFTIGWSYQPSSTISWNGRSLRYVYTSVDQAVIDFGPGALNGAGYPAAEWDERYSIQGLANALTPVGYGTADGKAFTRTVRPNLTGDRLVTASSTDQSIVTVPAKVAPFIGGCHGDSGGPIVFAGTNKIIGVASAKYNATKPLAFMDTTKPCPGNDTTTYSLFNRSHVNSAISKLNAATSFPATKYFALDLFNTTAADVSPKSDAALRFVSTLTAPHVVTPSSGSTVWKTIPDPVNSSKILPSIFAGGVLNRIAAAGNGERTSEWKATSLKRGYYKVEFFYQQSADNAKCLTMQYRTGYDTGFKTYTKKLDQSVGGTASTSQTAAVGGFLPVYKNATPYATSNAASYIWVNTSTATTANGTLAVKLSDIGCPGGNVMADTIRLTWVSGIK